MFGKKSEKKIEERATKNIQVIPDDFYGAKDPVVHYEPAKMAEKTSNPVIKNISNVSSVNVGSKISNLFQNKIFVYSLVGVGFLLVVVGITWYYLKDAGLIGVKNKNEIVVPKTENNQQNVVTTNTEQNISDLDLEVVVTTTPTTTEILTATSLGEQVIDFPSLNLLDSADVDNDSLTDIEEELFNTDSGVWDTDKDGYFDGQEVTNLYNPKGLAPVKLIDSGLVQEFVNPMWQYRVYYPVVWQVGVVDEQSKQVLFSSVNGDYVEVLVEKMNQGEQFIDWFARRAIGQQYTDITTFSNRFREDGYKRRDGLVIYFVQNNNVYILLYHTGSTGMAYFRNTFDMMVASFRPSKTLVEIPDQVILPALPTTTDLTGGEDINVMNNNTNF